MHEAVTMLKGVMGFTDQPLTSPPELRRIRTIPPSYSETRLRRPIASFTTQSRSSSASPRKGPNRPTEEVLLALEADPNIPSTVRALPMPLRPGNELTLPSRSRAITDPFIDPRSGLSPQNSRTASGRGPAPPPPQSRQGVQAQGGDGASPATGRCCTTRSIEVSERERE